MKLRRVKFDLLQACIEGSHLMQWMDLRGPLLRLSLPGQLREHLVRFLRSHQAGHVSLLLRRRSLVRGLHLL